MKYIFIVQGEGRGHMTQAISLFKILSEAGHEVSHVVVGKSKRRELPDFVGKQINCPITRLDSPNFVADKHQKSVNFTRTIFFNLRRMSHFISSVNSIDKIVKEEKPDAIINFYDFLGGLYFLIKKPKIKHIAIAHQFILNHSTFEFPKGRVYDKLSMLLGNRLTSIKADLVLSLSFQPLESEPSKNLIVTPPLLREEIKQQKITEEDHFLIYMVNHGYSTQIEEFHKKYPSIPLHCFWDKPGVPKEQKIDDTLTFHQLDDIKFIELMASCKGYLTTAGFESICEAMYMGKPVLMVPVKGHYEQSCNALDATNAGAGISSETFDLELLLNYLPNHQSVKEEFKGWCEKSSSTFLTNLIKHVN
ncbi:MAG: glycosyltransferase family protein [Ekhidna sp.]